MESTKQTFVPAESVLAAAECRPPHGRDLGDPPPRGLSVWKHPFNPLFPEEMVLSLPEPACVLAVDWEGERAVLHILVDPEAARCERHILIVQTSREGLPRQLGPQHFVATIRNGAGCAFHVFEL